MRTNTAAAPGRRLLVIAVCDHPAGSVAAPLEDDIGELATALPAGTGFTGFFYDVLVYTTALPQHTAVTGRFRTRLVPADTGAWSADIVSALADFAEAGRDSAGAGIPDGCAAIDPLETTLDFPPFATRTASITYTVMPTCTATVLDATVQITSTSTGTLLAKADAIPRIAPSSGTSPARQ